MNVICKRRSSTQVHSKISEETPALVRAGCCEIADGQRADLIEDGMAVPLRLEHRQDGMSERRQAFGNVEAALPD